MRICILYDCLHPFRVGGAERWYYNLALRLAAAGHQVTYLTLRQWPKAAEPTIPGIRVVAVGPRLAYYGRRGNRTIAPPLLFGLGVLFHLIIFGRRYDAVHTASFPYFSVLAAAVVRPFARFRIIVDWHEFWSRPYWAKYLGTLGAIGWWVQWLCLRVPQNAFCFAELTASRLRENGVCGPIEVLTGEYAGDLAVGSPAIAERLVVFAGRLIPEKRALLAIEAIALAQQQIDDLKGVIFGDGPELELVRQAIDKYGLGSSVEAPGFVDQAVLDDCMSKALCLLHPSEREGYGLVVIEAAARGVPALLVQGEDNAATELIVEGVNGFVALEASPEALAENIVRVHRAGRALRNSTANWASDNAGRLSIDSSLRAVLRNYRI